MNRLIPVICFTLLTVISAEAKVTPIGSVKNLPQMQQKKQQPEVRMVEEADFEKIVVEGFSHAQKGDVSQINVNMNVVKKQKTGKENKEKSVFEKIYEKALERIDNSSPKRQREDVLQSENFAASTVQEQQTQWQDENIPVIKTELPPDNKMTTIVAMEHIPYLMNSIEILPSGMVKFEETVVVVANGNKLRRGLSKILPLNIYNNKGQKHRIDYSIIDVTINDEKQDFYLTSDDEHVYILPKNDYSLDSGVYTYKFEYIADNVLWRDGDSYQFFWDVGGNGWNLVVDRLGASLNMPVNAWQKSDVLLGTVFGLQSDQVEIRDNNRTGVFYTAKRPLFIGEGMYIISSINADALMPETMWQKIIRYFYDRHDVILSFFGFITVIISFVLSWKFILKDKGQLKLSLNKTALMIRYLMTDKFDIKSVCGFLLEVYKKNIIDIQQTGNTILLIKKTDNLNGLNSDEKKALKCLFPKHETTFTVSPENNLPFKRFAKFLSKSLKAQIIRFQAKLLGGYFVMGVGLLLTTEAVMAGFEYRGLYDFGIMVLATLIGSVAIILCLLRLKKWLKAVVYFVSADILLLSLILFSAVISPLAGLFLVASLIVIGAALRKYSKRSGLVSHYIKDLENFKDYLLKHRDTILLGNDFRTYQPAIFVLDLETRFMSKDPKEYDKLSIMNNIAKLC